MKIQELTVGMIQTHTYFLIDEASKHTIVVDPGDEADRIIRYIEDNGLFVEKILLTHGHFDHIGAVEALKSHFNVPVWMHEEGKRYLEDPQWNLSYICHKPYTVHADRYLKDKDIITMDANPSIQIELIFAPGHTMDGTAFYIASEKVALVGDVIFNGAVGRCDHPGGNMSTLLQSIKERIFTLPEDTILLPGHGPSTTVGHEKATNPFFD